jgi:hypothetical protein
MLWVMNYNKYSEQAFDGITDAIVGSLEDWQNLIEAE